MKFFLKVFLVLAVLGGLGAAAISPVRAYLKKRNQTNWRLMEVEQGDIISVVNSTGEIRPVKKVQIGSFVSGPIIEIHVDFNDRVKAGDKLAKIDPRLFDANVRREEATLKTREAEVERVQALLQQARNNEQRAKALHKENPEFISGTEMDQFVFNKRSLEAQLTVATASVDQAQASLENAQANLGYTNIVSPVDGIIIDKKIEDGQTLAASFTTPEMFVLAIDMDKHMHVFASVDEADMGMIMAAKDEGQPVEFTVDAWPGEVFAGEIEQIRVSSTVEQNVVTYPVVVRAPNPDMKLLPGMTAEISFRVDQRQDVVKVPNSALRFFPLTEQVRESDRQLLDGDDRTIKQEEDNANTRVLSAAEKAEAKRNQKRKHVWVVEGDLLKAVEVVTGLSDSKFTELVSGDLKPGQELVTGTKRR
ncbi:MAG: efflux RND transporter periplasmic adaptor subunit [Planctomycetales bacterium]|nr:efflux RND transporter periplasmic adaptor subunit [Planctomycetales bacterium]